MLCGSQIERFHAQMTASDVIGDGGLIAATVNALADDDVRECVDELLAIAHELDWAWH
jgi:hypothetical protein